MTDSPNDEIADLEFTGERYVPGEAQGDIELEHQHRYLLARELVAGKAVLDIASGEGYGSFLLASAAAKVIGVDISQQAVEHAQVKYAAENLTFRQGSCGDIPLTDASVDAVVSFETIEHHAEHEAMMTEIKRVLRPDGFLIISCPDKYEYSDKPNYQNEFHVKELYREEFRNLLKEYFKNHCIYGQRVVYGSLVLSEEGSGDIGSYDISDRDLNVISGTPQAVYLIAVASDKEIPRLKSGIFQQPVGDSGVVKELSAHGERLESALESLSTTLNSLVTDRDSQKTGVIQLQNALQELSMERDEQVSQLNQVIASRDEQVSQLNQVIASRDEQVSQLNQVIASRDEQISQLNQIVVVREASIVGMNMELTALYNSKSWRLTAPLRKLVWWGLKLVSLLSRSGRQHRKILASTTMALSAVPDRTANDGKITQHGAKFRILLVSFYCPTRAHAGGLRILDIYALIRKQCPSVQLDLFTFHRPSIDWSLDDAHRIFHNVYLSPVEDFTPTTLASLRGEPLTYDVIDLQFHQSGRHIDAYKQIGKKVIFTPMESAAKALFLHLRTNFNLSSFLPLRKFAASVRAAEEEIEFIQKVDEVVCVSRSDAAFLRAITSLKRVRGVDTGVSQFEFEEALAPDFETTKAANKPVSIIYVAYFGSETNVLALRWYLEHVHPLVKARVPEYTLTVVGRGDLSPFAKFREKSVNFVGEVPSIAPHISEARVSIAPALGGSGFRGKVNQYAVLGCPCVVSPIAFKGLAYQDGVSISIAEAPELFADRCIQLLTDLDLNDRMGQAARRLCLDRYSWASKWPAIREIYKLQGVA
jgi:ubiquinone/menaquinone biosynthesis C-methylase UbiE/glycosyltransferase involved in cell wall biosynthesis